MKYPRVLLRPSICHSSEPGSVIIRTPLEDPNTYYETVLSADEAHMLGLELLMDANRARCWLQSEARQKV